jgi:cytoskeletal protein RodZ
MDHFERHEKLRAAKQRLRAQRLRAGALRGRVVVISLITFALIWGVVFVQMATGNDPVLGDNSKTVASAQQSGRGEKAAPVESGGTDAVQAAAEAIETTEPDEVEAEPAELEPIEEEPVELEPEPEPEPVEEELAPVTTGQS